MRRARESTAAPTTTMSSATLRAQQEGCDFHAEVQLCDRRFEGRGSTWIQPEACDGGMTTTDQSADPCRKHVLASRPRPPFVSFGPSPMSSPRVRILRYTQALLLRLTHARRIHLTVRSVTPGR